MIARSPAVPIPKPALTQADQEQFLQLLPSIRRAARFAFRHRRAEVREELMAEVIALAFTAYCRLIERGKAALIYPTVLAKYGIKQLCQGRRVGVSMNVNDIGSEHCQKRKGVCVMPFWRFNPAQGQWQELVVEDRRAGPADLAATRIDFADWLQQLPRTKRGVAELLATGEQSQVAARRLRLSVARISQLRRELESSWQHFQSERISFAA